MYRVSKIVQTKIKLKYKRRIKIQNVRMQKQKILLTRGSTVTHAVFVNIGYQRFGLVCKMYVVWCFILHCFLNSDLKHSNF